MRTKAAKRMRWASEVKAAVARGHGARVGGYDAHVHIVKVEDHPMGHRVRCVVETAEGLFKLGGGYLLSEVEAGHQVALGVVVQTGTFMPFREREDPAKELACLAYDLGIDTDSPEDLRELHRAIERASLRAWNERRK